MKGSLLRCLLWRLSLVSGLLVLVVAVIIAGHFRRTAGTLRDRNLSGQAADIARHLRLDGGVRPTVELPPDLHETYAESDGMFVYQVLDPVGRVLLSSDQSRIALQVPDEDDLVTPDLFEVNRTVGGVTLTFFGKSLPVRRGDKLFVIQVAQGPQHMDALVDEFMEKLWKFAGWAFVLVFGVVVGVIYITVRASLSPITDAAQDAASIGPRSIDRRIAIDKVPNEVKPLVEAFNNALDRIGESYRKQREFTDNAAHELRTPIAVLRAHVDALNDGDVARELGSDIALLDRLVGQLLRLAQADDLRIPKCSKAELNAIMLETAALMGPAAIDAGKSVAARQAPHPVWVFGDAGYIAIALRNLIENALRATPEGSAVEIAVKPDGTISVLDRGPGVPADQRSRIFERFWRSGEPGGGAGLGLSIVKRIVEAHGGTIEVGDRPSGGACFRLGFKVLTPRNA